MKTTSKLILTILVVAVIAYTSFTAYSAFTILDNANGRQLEYHLLADGESFDFGTDVKPENSRTIAKRGAYDGSRYRWEQENGNLKVSSVHPAMGQHQSELVLDYCQGTITQRDDTAFIDASSNFKKIYVFEIAKNPTVDSFSKSLNIRIVTKSLKSTKSSLLVTTDDWGVNAVALPHGVKTKQIWKAQHPKKTVAEFAYLSISDSEGKQVNYPAGDYVLIGAERLLQ